MDHSQEPVFITLQILVKSEFIGSWAPSGTLTSRTKTAWLQGLTEIVAVGTCGKGVAVGFGLVGVWEGGCGGIGVGEEYFRGGVRS